MAISTYAQLQTALATYTHRDDTTARIPEFIQMGEADLNRKIKTVDMETRATAVTQTTTRFMALPVGYMEIRSIYMQAPAKELMFMAPSALRDIVVSETNTGEPSAFTIKDEIEFDCIPDQAYTLETHYLKKYDIATDSTNWLLTNYPNLYLYSAMVHASIYEMNDARAQMFMGYVDNEIATVNRHEARKRRTGNTFVRAEPAITSTGRVNIQTGV
jgi:hypothetical protein